MNAAKRLFLWFNLHAGFIAALVWVFPVMSLGQGGLSAGYEFADDIEDWRLRYDEVGIFCGGWARAERDGRQGFVNEAGEVVIELKFNNLGVCFKLGLASFQDDNGKWGYIDKEGNEAIKAQFDSARGFDEDSGLAAAGIIPAHKLLSKWGYINLKGEWAIAPQFDFADRFSENLALTQKWIYSEGAALRPQAAYIDTKGKTAIQLPDNVDYGLSFKNGFAAVKANNEKWGYINSKGEWAIAPQFDYASFVDKDGEAKVRLNGQLRRIRLQKP